MSNRQDAAAGWREVLRRYAGSGLSVAAFCRRSRIPQASFYFWRRKLREAGCFTEVRVVPDPASGTGVIAPPRPCHDEALELVLSLGRRIVVRAGFDPATLRALIDALEPGTSPGGAVHVDAPRALRVDHRRAAPPRQESGA